jgi:hypothetical protein
MIREFVHKVFEVQYLPVGDCMFWESFMLWPLFFMDSAIGALYCLLFIWTLLINTLPKPYNVLLGLVRMLTLLEGAHYFFLASGLFLSLHDWSMIIKGMLLVLLVCLLVFMSGRLSHLYKY